MNQRLLEAYQANQEEVADELIRQHLPLVRTVVHRLSRAVPRAEREDLENVGIVALLGAARNFDAERGAAFSTYAYVSIRSAILDELRRMDVLPRGRRDSVREYEDSNRQLEEELGRPPTFLEIQERLQLSADELEELLRVRAIADAFGRGLGEASTGISPETFLGGSADDPAQAAQANEARNSLAEAIATLPKREQDVVVLYYQGGLLLREIGMVLEITESRVSQILKHALVLLHHRLGSDQMVDES